MAKLDHMHDMTLINFQAISSIDLCISHIGTGGGGAHIIEIPYKLIKSILSLWKLLSFYMKFSNRGRKSISNTMEISREITYKLSRNYVESLRNFHCSSMKNMAVTWTEFPKVFHWNFMGIGLSSKEVRQISMEITWKFCGNSKKKNPIKFPLNSYGNCMVVTGVKFLKKFHGKSI